ncbi:hypothetical protein JCM30760_19680 [Thiomicrorhabdus hydrogeniphila]
MHKYVINDVWMALKLSSINFFVWMLVLWGILIFFGAAINPADTEAKKLIIYFFYFSAVLTPIIFIQSIFIYFANRKYIVDLETGLITFPRTDIENSILEIILLYPYWNLMRTATIHATEVENLFLDTKRWSTKHKVANGATASGKTKYRTETKKHVRYTINIAGKFGSANLQFLDRQKRDEVRNAIQQCVKQHSGINIDRKVAEFN